MKTVAIAVLALAFVTPAVAADPQPQQEADAGKPKKPAKICKRQESSSSRVARSVCKTAEQWVQAADDYEARMDTMGGARGPGAGLPGGPQ